MPADRSKHTRTVSTSTRRIASGMYPVLSPSNAGPSGCLRRISTRVLSGNSAKRAISRKFTATGTSKTALGYHPPRPATGTPPLIAAAMESGFLTPNWRSYLMEPSHGHGNGAVERVLAVNRPRFSECDWEEAWEDVDLVYDVEDQLDDLAALYQGFHCFEELGEVECVMGIM